MALTKNQSLQKVANVNPMLPKRQTDWYKYLCQKDKTNEALPSPPTHHVRQYDGYVMLAINVPLFHELNKMPIILDPTRLNEVGVIKATVRRNQEK